MPDGRILDLDSEARIGNLPAYLVGVEANETNPKLQKPLLTRWWHVNVCAMQILEIYKVWVNMFDHMHEIPQDDRVSLIS